MTDRVVEPGAVPPQENAPEAEEKSPDDAPSDDQQTELSEGDIVDLYASTEEL